MDYRKKIKEEREIIDGIVHRPDLEGLVVFSCFNKDHASVYVCASLDNFIKMLGNAAMTNEGVEYAIRAALQAIDNYREQKKNGNNNPILN